MNTCDNLHLLSVISDILVVIQIKPVIEVILVGKQLRHEEVKQTPEFTKIILKRSTSE